VINIEHETVIERPPEEVFAYVTDVAKVPEWQDGVVDARQETAGPVALGTRFVEVRNFLGRRLESTVEVTDFEPDRVFTLATSSGPVPFTIEQRFEPSNGGTRVVVHGHGEPGGFFRVAEPLVARQVKRLLEHNFGTLKDLLESRD
jgi:uncharacterized protein YndB with AHSA1/START domain